MAVVNEQSVFEPLKFYCGYTWFFPPVWEKINTLKLMDYLLIQADKPWYNYSLSRHTVRHYYTTVSTVEDANVSPHYSAACKIYTDEVGIK